jgi:hypothetical protein
MKFEDLKDDDKFRFPDSYDPDDVWRKCSSTEAQCLCSEDLDIDGNVFIIDPEDEVERVE